MVGVGPTTVGPCNVLGGSCSVLGGSVRVGSVLGPPGLEGIVVRLVPARAAGSDWPSDSPSDDWPLGFAAWTTASVSMALIRRPATTPAPSAPMKNIPGR